MAKAPGRLSHKRVFQSLERKAYDIAQAKMTAALPYVMDEVLDDAYAFMRELNKSPMTGNYINSWGIALYRNGQYVACATTNDIEGDSPIQVTLANGDVFEEGRMRYDGSVQKSSFKAPTGTRRIFADQEVVRWLRRYPPRVRKGKGISSLAYRIVCVVDYQKYVNGDKVMLKIIDEIERRGGDIRTFNLG